MADILEYLNIIENAVYGKDVRQAIVDGISQCYTDGKAGASDLQARQLIEAVAAVNEEQTAALEVLQAKIEELEEGEGGTQQSTTVDIPTVLVDGGVEENVAVNNNSTVIHHVTFTTEFTEIPKVMVAIGKNAGAVSQYGYLSANILYPTVSKTGFDFFLANRTGSDRSPGVVWYAYQPTVETIDLDITIPDAQGMTESQVRAITGPISAAVDAIKTGYDGTVYQTAAEAIRTQINALHVLIGDEPGTAISAFAIGYGEESVEDALDGLNGRLEGLEGGGGATYEVIFSGTSSENVDIAFSLTTAASWINGEYANASGEIVTKEASCHTDYIMVKPGTHILTDVFKVNFYDINQNFVSRGSNGVGVEITIPNNAYYVIFSHDSRAYDAYIKDRAAKMKRDYEVNSFYLLNDRLHVEWANVDNKDLSAFDGFERRLAGTAIKEANKMRHGLRLATFNAYGTGSAGVKNWTAIKEHLEQHGVDIVGFQEIYKPNTTNVDGKTFAEALTSWNLNTFAVIDENIDTNCRPVAAISGFTVASTTEVKYTRQSNYGNRYYTKTELQLPRWMDKKWSENLKMSVYNTQLELSATTGVAQAQELVAAILTDTNPFIVITGDFNDESYAKNVWKVFTDAGFTPAVNSFDSPTAGRGWYDNIFVNDRIAIKEHDIVPSDLVTYRYSGVSYVISDHDLVTADVVLDYSNIVTITHRNCDISVTGTKDGVTTTLNSDWFDRRDGHITIVASNPAEGYTLTGMAVWDGDWSLPNNKYPTGIVTIDGATVEFDADEIIGDFVVNAAQA